MTKIITGEEPVLRSTAKALTFADIKSKTVQKLISNMKAALSKEKYGVAIAAPQIGKPVQLFVVRGIVFAVRAGEEDKEKIKKYPDEVFINPEVVKVSKKKKTGSEGCLSVPGKYGTKVERADKITISYLDENGKNHTRGASGFLAQIFQHEIDHLNGILYTDHAKEVIDVDKDLKPLKTEHDVHALRTKRALG